jgi:hypothetical protein
VAFIVRYGRCCLCHTSEALGFYTREMVRHGLSFLGLGPCRRLRLLLSQLTRMHDHKA